MDSTLKDRMEWSNTVGNGNTFATAARIETRCTALTVYGGAEAFRLKSAMPGEWYEVGNDGGGPALLFPDAGDTIMCGGATYYDEPLMIGQNEAVRLVCYTESVWHAIKFGA